MSRARLWLASALTLIPLTAQADPVTITNGGIHIDNIGVRRRRLDGSA